MCYFNPTCTGELMEDIDNGDWYCTKCGGKKQSYKGKSEEGKA